jgi:hypothetical protein
MRDEIQSFSDEEIMSCDFDEWADFFVSKYSIATIEVFENNIEKTMQETKVEQNNSWSKHDPYEPKYFKIDGYEIAFHIPFDGDSELLYLIPSSRILTNFDVASVDSPKGDSCGKIVLTFSFTAQELKDKNDNANDFVYNYFSHEFSNYKKMIGNVNAEITQFNSQIRDVALQLMEARRKKANDFAMLSQSLNIPLKRNPNAPKTSPIPLQRVVKKSVAKPASKPMSSEYSISDSDYRNIVNIIHNVCTSMEATAKTFVKVGEEELRDFVIATLNTHYPNMVSGETFRKVGKTDIHIVFENKAAFIGECKIWHGIKKFEEAVEQLFGYSTWKDTKTSVIVFNKDIKDFSSIQSNVLEWIKVNAIRYTQVNGNIIDCVIHRADKNTDVDVSVHIYDLN